MLNPENTNHDGRAIDNPWEDFMKQETITPQLNSFETKGHKGYEEHITYVDDKGNETHMKLNPEAIAKSALKEEDPEGLELAAALLRRADERVKRGEYEFSEKVDSNGKTIESNRAIKVDDSSRLGQYIANMLKKQQTK